MSQIAFVAFDSSWGPSLINQTLKRVSAWCQPGGSSLLLNTDSSKLEGLDGVQVQSFSAQAESSQKNGLSLIDFLKDHRSEFTWVFFFGSPSPWLAEGLNVAGNQGVLIDLGLAQPEGQNRPVPLYLSAKNLLFLTLEGQKEVAQLVGPSVYPKSWVLGQENPPPATEIQTEPPSPKANRVVQLLPDLAPYDAISNSALYLKEFFVQLGYDSLVLAERFPVDFEGKVDSFSAEKVNPTDILLLHHSIASDAQAHCFADHQGKKILIYHNITPHHFFEGYSKDLVSLLQKGRKELSTFATDEVVAFGVSEFNRRELLLLGFQQTGVLPLMVDPRAWDFKPDPKVQQALTGNGEINLLFVGRIVPNKCQKDLVWLMSYLVTLNPKVHLYLVGGEDSRIDYHHEIRRLIKKLGLRRQITLTGSVKQNELMAYYMGADLYLSMSEHEGFGVPLVEAMWFDLPLYAYASTAVPETLGEAGFLFYNKTNLPQLAREVSVILTDRSIQKRMKQLQAKRRVDFLPENLTEKYQTALGELSSASKLKPSPAQKEGQKRPRWAFVVQRYGEKVVGGAESHCLQITQHLSSYVDVEVLTTCADDFKTWADVYPPGIEQCSEQITVHRFPVKQERDIPSFTTWERAYVFKDAKPGQVLDIPLGVAEEWIKKQGPETPALIDYLKEHHHEYDAVIFYTYLYYPTYFGTQICPEKAWLVSTAHDEAPIYLPAYDEMVKRVQGVVFNTEAERDFMARRFPHTYLHGDVMGIGISPPPEVARPDRFISKFKLDGPYILYLGRIDPNKGCGLMFDYFIKYKKKHPGPLNLVLAGKSEVEIPEHPEIRFVGYLSEQEKHDALAGCELLLNPSPFESLSMILLEAWYHGRPVLVNQKCEVTVAQTKKADGGSWFEDYPSFDRELTQLLGEDRDYQQAKRFVQFNYSWPVIEAKYLSLIGGKGL